MVDLFIGLLDPVSGKILIDDNNLTNNKSSWHNLISYVPQSPIILDGTILFNIAYAKHKEDIDKEKVLETIKISGLEEFIQSLPHGLDTYVGEKGVKLSGGQIQRVALARALYKKPKCLILDEATSSLDINTESHIVESINRLSNKITIIVVAHRFDTIKYCDEILELCDGKILNSYSQYDFRKKFLTKNDE